MSHITLGTTLKYTNTYYSIMFMAPMSDQKISLQSLLLSNLIDFNIISVTNKYKIINF